MPVVAVLRAAWRGALVLTPAPLLRALDDWARRKAQARAELRRAQAVRLRDARR